MSVYYLPVQFVQLGRKFADFVVVFVKTARTEYYGSHVIVADRARSVAENAVRTVGNVVQKYVGKSDQLYLVFVRTSVFNGVYERIFLVVIPLDFA